jgi:hypothetical protein
MWPESGQNGFVAATRTPCVILPDAETSFSSQSRFPTQHTRRFAAQPSQNPFDGKKPGWYELIGLIICSNSGF